MEDVVVLTGAGISTGAGIPDFRGPEGVWTKNSKAERISTLSWYLRDPEVRKLAWQARLDSGMLDAQPTPAHKALVDFEGTGRLRAIITQNTDGLHLLAGSAPSKVLEMHGNMRTWRCEDCGETGDMRTHLDRVLAGDPDPACPVCGGITRATVILFEEALDAHVIDAAVEAVQNCGTIIAVGTSLTVHPVAGLFEYAVRGGAKGVIINAEPTPYDLIADEVIREDIQQALPAYLGRIS